MTTDKIRVAALALLDTLAGPHYDDVVSERMQDLRTALAEPAQAAPADDAVPVVAQASTAVEAYGREGPHLFWTAAATRIAVGDYIVRQADHLAAIGSIQKELAQAKALSVRHILLAVVPGEDGMGEEVYAQSVTEVENLLADLGEKAEERDLLRQENGRLKADRSAQVAEVMSLVTGYGNNCFECGEFDLDNPPDNDAAHAEFVEKVAHGRRLKEAIEAAVRKLAGGEA